MANNRKLGRVSSHRKAMLRNLATDVIMHGKIETTATRAKEAAAILQNVVDPATGKTAVQVLFDDVAPKFKGKNGGYTRVIKTYNRKGDNAPMAIIGLF